RSSPAIRIWDLERRQISLSGIRKYRTKKFLFLFWSNLTTNWASGLSLGFPIKTRSSDFFADRILLPTNHLTIATGAGWPKPKVRFSHRPRKSFFFTIIRH